MGLLTLIYSDALAVSPTASVRFRYRYPLALGRPLMDDPLPLSTTFHA